MDIEKLGLDQRVSPSRIVGCARKAYFEAKGYMMVPSPELQAVFDEGRERHEAVQELFALMGLRDVEKKVFWYDPPLYGRIDGTLMINGEPALFEMKTTSKHPKNLTEPMESHVDQAQIYMHITGMKLALIYYQSKVKSLEPSEASVWFFVHYDEERAKVLMKRGKYILWCVNNNVIPFAECYRCEHPACHDKQVRKEIKEAAGD